MAVSADMAAKRYQDSMQSGATKQRYIDGINATTVNPMALAATPEAMQKYQDRIMESIRTGKRAKRLQETSVQSWKSGATDKGASRLASGAQQAANKVRAHFAKWGPIYDQAAQAAAAISGSGRDAALQKVKASMDVLMNAAGRE